MPTLNLISYRPNYEPVKVSQMESAQKSAISMSFEKSVDLGALYSERKTIGNVDGIRPMASVTLTPR